MNQAMRKSTIGWKVSSLTADIASIRYRAMLPLLALEDNGFECKIFSDASFSNFSELDVLVIVKSFSFDDYLLVQRAVSNGIPVVLELCDNIFIDLYGVKSELAKPSPAQMFLAMARLSKAIVVTTEPLAEVVREQVGYNIPVHAIPDGIETRVLLDKSKERLSLAIRRQKIGLIRIIRSTVSLFKKHAHRLHAHSLRSIVKYAVKTLLNALSWNRSVKITRRLVALTKKYFNEACRRKSVVEASKVQQFDADIKRILWFGNHGALYANFGMLDLLEIREELNQISKEFNVELVVVSNNSSKFHNHIRPLSIKTRYVEWSHSSLSNELRLADVVVVPNTLDPFSICKSANRTVLALTAGKPVVATSTSALTPLAGCVVTDDFLGGLRRYLGDSSHASYDVCIGQQRIEKHFGQKIIAAEWTKVISSFRGMQYDFAQTISADLIVVLNLIQDLDLALPIIEEAKRNNISVVTCCNLTLLQKSPRVIKSLNGAGVKIWVLPDEIDDRPRFRFTKEAKALITLAESNLGPHRFTRRLTEQAKAAGLITATIQHGFENVGLTYDDCIHQINTINIIADKIYLWGHLDTLHANIASNIRNKCIAVGCPKYIENHPVDLSRLLPQAQLIVGVFENLHWHRYSDKYREFFIEGVMDLARKFPSVIFLVKSHHAGRWLARQKLTSLLTLDNLIIADAAYIQWEPYTASALMGNFAAVISTPSTVVLDAARAGLPVAVVGYDLELKNYAPLTKLVNISDWEEFVNTVTNPELKRSVFELSQDFVDKVILPGNGAERIIADLFSKRLQSGVVLGDSVKHIGSDVVANF